MSKETRGGNGNQQKPETFFARGREGGIPTDASQPISLANKRKERDASIRDLIEKSSLGTPAAKVIRSLTPQEVVESILARARELAGTPDATVTPLVRKETGKKPHKSTE